MSDKLISKDARLKKLRNWNNEYQWPLDLDEAIALVENAPVIEDVATVVHSRWILDSSDEYADHYHCGKCCAEIDLCNEIYTELTPNYCQNCGAKMDGGGEK